MASQVSSASIVNLFKKVYGDLTDLVPQGYPVSEMIPFSQGQKIGESYNEAVVLTNENGWTLGGTAGDSFQINPARAGSVQQATIPAYMSVMSSVVPWAVLSRSAAGNSEKAFASGTKYIVKNNLKSHMKLVETLAMYGQADALLGYVSYATATYRGVSFTNGTGTLTGTAFGSVAFTNGINASGYILLAPGSFASGIWIGSEGAQLNQVDSSGVVVASGSIVAVDSAYGILKVDFIPVAASSTTSHRLCFEGQQSAKDMVGVNKIITNTGSLFGINAAQYSLWRGNSYSMGNALLTFTALQTVVANSVNNGGLEGDIEVLVNNRTFAKMISAEAAKRMFDQSYKPAELEEGAQSLKFYYGDGSMTIKGSRFVKEGEAYGFSKDTWVRSGSAQIAMSVPGIDKEVIYQLENSAAYGFRSFSDQYLFCRAPAKNFVITGINDEAAS